MCAALRSLQWLAYLCLVLHVSSQSLDIFNKPQPGGVQYIGLCIIGQLARLETVSKLSKFITPNHGDNRKIYVAGLLDEGKPYFTNRGQNHDTECYSSSTNMSAVFQKLSLKNVDVELYASPPLKIKLTPLMKEIFKTYRHEINITKQQREIRIQGNLRQFSHDAQCYEKLRNYELSRNITFDVVLRLRDNALVARPFDPIDLMKSARNSKTLLRNCSNWGGVNDKVWLIPRVHMEGVLAHVTRDVLSSREYLIAAQPLNAEGLVRTVWEHYGVNYVHINPFLLPIVDARCTTPGNNLKPPKFTYVPSWKDCRADNLPDPTATLHV
jgi:hypothetical protein